MPDVRRITVIGAGTMGHGIAQVAAMSGYFTVMTDTNPSIVDEAVERIQRNLNGAVERGKITRADADKALKRISRNAHLSEAVSSSDFVVEAVAEDMDLKKSLFAELDKLVARETILVTNTSSLSVAEIARASGRPDRVAGMHFFNPVHIMKLVEVVRHDAASADTIEAVVGVARQMGKQPILVHDRPGFASSRLGVVLGLEAMRMVEQGVASAEDIDKAMELGYGHPMGPLRVSDLVGLDVRLAIAQHLHRELKEPHYAPPAILKNKVAAGELGKKTGKGFYEWDSKTS